MEPASAVVLTILQYGLKYGPDAIKVVRRLLTKAEPTEADWAELDGILEKTGEGYFVKIPVGTLAGVKP